MASSKNMNVCMPMEVCDVVPNQRVKGKLEDAMAALMIRNTALPPSKKFKEIQNGINTVKNICAQPMKQYGLEIDMRPVSTEARVLKQPAIEYRSNKLCHMRDNGVWDMRNCQFMSTTGARKAALLCFAQCHQQTLERFAGLLCNAARNVGLNISTPRIFVYDGSTTTEKAINDAKRDNCDLVLVVLSSRDPYHTYEEVKLFADTRYGIVSQCVNQRLIDSDKMDMRTALNICLKINTKLGGVNHGVSEWPIALRREGVIVMGADVIHHASDGFPSIAALVGCIDEGISKYAVSCRAMLNPRGRKTQETILDMESMTRSVLISYYKKNGQLKPKKILFYRDGVSEGQFQQVFDEEIPLIKKACKSLQQDYQPTITFVIVQKRHPYRMRPEDDRDGVGRGKNVPPGTIADKDIVDPQMYEFFLCSHEGIQGTSKPARYTVLLDENKVAVKDLEKLSYYLCHVFARCNRGISIPAPVKYADLLCTRASDYVKTLLKNRPPAERAAIAESGEIPKEITEMVNSIEKFPSNMFFI